MYILGVAIYVCRLLGYIQVVRSVALVYMYMLALLPYLSCEQHLVLLLFAVFTT